jgi:uncharacterized membrane protein YeaQ/YmgE (transglycosylase-associated protein family)
MGTQTFLALVLSFFMEAKLHIILALVFVDVAVGIAGALHLGRFEWRKVGEFYRTMVLPYVVSYLTVYVVGRLIPGVVGDYVATGLDYVAFSTIVASLVGSIVANLRLLKFQVPTTQLRPAQ